MQLEIFRAQLAHNAETIRSLVDAVTKEQVHWKPEPAAWSMIEVINHLYDEEREDFRLRLDLLLHHPNQSWPDINPPGWVIERRYSQRDFQTSLTNFLAERQQSIAWLKTVSNPNWQAVYNLLSHPITAGDLRASWLAHDYLHMRQLVELKWGYAAQQFQPFSVRYAGEW